MHQMRDMALLQETVAEMRERTEQRALQEEIAALQQRVAGRRAALDASGVASSQLQSKQYHLPSAPAPTLPYTKSPTGAFEPYARVNAYTKVAQKNPHVQLVDPRV